MLPSAQNLIQKLKEKNAFLCTVESCTGGFLINELTDISGSSEVLWGGLVTYDNSAKRELLGVLENTLDTHGAVSRPVAREMAEGGLEVLKRACQSRPRWLLSVSLTGIAGPLGGAPDKPVGLCWIGVSALSAEGAHLTEELQIQSPSGSSRSKNKEFFAAQARFKLAQILETLS